MHEASLRLKLRNIASTDTRAIVETGSSRTKADDLEVRHHFKEGRCARNEAAAAITSKFLQRAASAPHWNNRPGTRIMEKLHEKCSQKTAAPHPSSYPRAWRRSLCIEHDCDTEIPFGQSSRLGLAPMFPDAHRAFLSRILAARSSARAQYLDRRKINHWIRMHPRWPTRHPDWVRRQLFKRCGRVDVATRPPEFFLRHRRRTSCY